MVTTGESITIVQGTDAWREQRRGNITSSEVYRLMAEPRLKADKEAGNLSEGAKTYIRELIAEDLVPPPTPFENDAIRWGHENEPIARFFYQKSTGIIIETVGYIPSSIIGYGGSPDGITTEQSAAIFGELDRAVMTFEPGCIEIKCPFSTANHIDHCLITSDDDLPTQYYWQCMSNIYITDSQWCDFVSFDPRIDHDCGLFIYRVKRDEEAIKKMLDKITRAIAYKQAIKSSLKLL